MASMLGRHVVLAIDSQTYATVRTKNISLNNNPVDITDDDSSGFRELLDEPGERQLNITLSGVTKSDLLRTKSFDGAGFLAVTLTYPDGGVVSGSFFLASYNETGEYNNAVTFDAELQSTGDFTYEPGS